MNVSLTPELEALIQEKVSTGLYTSASEVVREALRLLQERDEMRRIKTEALRRDIEIGLQASREGRVVAGEEAFARLRLRNEEAVRRAE